MFEVTTNKPKNLLTIRFSKCVTSDEAKRCVGKVEQCLSDLQPDFDLLTDLTGLEAMDFACTPHIKRSMDLCNKKGVKKIVRIIPDPHKDIGFSIMSLFHYRRRGVRIVTCGTPAEATQALAD